MLSRQARRVSCVAALGIALALALVNSAYAMDLKVNYSDSEGVDKILVGARFDIGQEERFSISSGSPGILIQDGSQVMPYKGDFRRSYCKMSLKGMTPGMQELRVPRTIEVTGNARLEKNGDSGIPVSTGGSAQVTIPTASDPSISKITCYFSGLTKGPTIGDLRKILQKVGSKKGEGFPDGGNLDSVAVRSTGAQDLGASIRKLNREIDGFNGRNRAPAGVEVYDGSGMSRRPGLSGFERTRMPETTAAGNPNR